MKLRHFIGCGLGITVIYVVVRYILSFVVVIRESWWKLPTIQRSLRRKSLRFHFLVVVVVDDDVDCNRGIVHLVRSGNGNEMTGLNEPELPARFSLV